MGLAAFVLAAHGQALERFCFLVLERDRYLLNLKLNRRGDFSHSHLLLKRKYFFVLYETGYNIRLFLWGW